MGRFGFCCFKRSNIGWSFIYDGLINKDIGMRFFGNLLVCLFVAGSLQTMAQTWDDNAYSLSDQGKYEDAIKVFLQHEREMTEVDQNQLAFCYEKLNDYPNAVKWYQVSVKNGNSSAMFNLARIYDCRYGTHQGVESNKEKAKQFYRQAIYSDYEGKGRAWSVLNLFLVCKDENNIEECKPIIEYAIRRKVDLNHAPYLMAHYLCKDKREAIYYYRISAEHGNDDAQYELAKILQEGKYIEKDLNEAVRWHRKAAEQGNWGAQQELGKCYEELYLKTLDERYLNSCLKYYYKIYTDDNDSGMPRIINLGDTSNIKVDKDGNWVVDDLNPLKSMYSKGLANADRYKTYEEWLEAEVKPLSVDSDVDINIPKNDIKSKTYALIIANENYNFEHYVPYAENDGETVRKYFENTLGVPVDNIHLISDASLNVMKREIEWLMDNSKGVDNLYFYYSGHAIPANDLSTSYLLPCDGYAKDPETGLDLQWLYNKLGSTDIPCYVFLDACFSGSGRDRQVLVESRGVAIKAKEVVPQNKTIVFTACSGTEMAYPIEEQKHGLFTYCFLKSLQKSEGAITLGELADYIKQNVSQYARKERRGTQSPMVVSSSAVADVWRNFKLK